MQPYASPAKFNGSVPGTLPTSSSECPPTTTLSTSHEMSPATSSNLLFPTSVSDIPNFQSYNSVWFALLLGVGIILIIILSVVCVVVEFQNRRQSQSRTTAIQPQDQGTCINLLNKRVLTCMTTHRCCNSSTT